MCLRVLRPWPVLVASILLLAILATNAASAAVDAATGPQQRDRLAIVIGNSDYRSDRLNDLPNASNDATKLADSLRRLNFVVVLGTNLTRDGFEQTFKEADTKLSNVSAVLIFFAGHGIQVNGRNYLLPVDTPDPTSLEAITSAAIKLDDIIARYASRNRQTFVFLDACRNNPLGNGAGVSNGLAQIDVGENMFVAFATQPGNVTVDGTGQNSPFTTALLKNLEIPGLSVSDMMIRVRNETEALTAGRQVPWDQSSLREQFYFTEQQVLDPAQLSASLSRILSDPVAKKELEVQLASSDLQTAVLIVGQTLRSVSIEGHSDAPAPAGGVQMASTSDASALQEAHQSVASGLQTLIVGSSGSEEDNKKTDLVRNVQTELRRLGCYRMQVDGDWGKGSLHALADYYRNTRQTGKPAEPSVDLLSDLFLRSGRVCKEPVIVKPKPTSVAADADDKAPSAGRKPGGRRSAGAARRPAAAPPPDIGGGIGIGGIF
ncbi:MAG: peptidase C14 [Rhizobiales bacterium 65-79]|jgi:hypothetical protein|nr:caspase family protein [Hyphomicrobiales bacterium]OJU02218.1 MAG: peptidase C14 [Rhizobiales bacterium 65-79]